MSVWIAIPALDMQNPNTTTAGTAIHMLALATAAMAASAPANEPLSAMVVKPDAWAR